MSTFDYIQTFYVDPTAVLNAEEIMLTSVDLFFKTKPLAGTGSSGAAKPGINIWICPVNNNEPDVTQVLKNSVVFKEYDHINTSTDSYTPTGIGFSDPVILKTGAYYGIVIKFQDPAYELWINTQGENLLGPNGFTNTPSPGSQSRFDGYLYHTSNSSTVDKLSSSDLKFNVKVANFNSSSHDVTLVNKNYEFFTIDRTFRQVFRGGEWVYQLRTAATGTVTTSRSSKNITGSGTNFSLLSRGDRIVVENGSSLDVLQVDTVVDATNIIVDKFVEFDGSGLNYYVPAMGKVVYTDYYNGKVYLIDSTANSSVKFIAGGNRIVGVTTGASANVVSLDSYQVDRFKPTFLLGNPSVATTSFTYDISNASKTMPGVNKSLSLLAFNDVSSVSQIHSRSVEVDSAGLYGTSRKSARIDINMNIDVVSDNKFAVPYLNSSELDMYVYQNDINNTYTETRNGITNYDTEIDKNGLARSKYVSKKINFAEGKYAEDLVVYLAAHRPADTEIRVYAKIHNTSDKDAFDDKAWTPLEIKNNQNKYSSINDPNDMYEYTYGFPQYPESYLSLSGKFTTVDDSDTITTTVNQTSYLAAGDLIRISSPLFEADNHEVFVVESVATNSITMTRPLTNNDIVGDMNVEKLKYKNIAWNNKANDNIVRYATSTGAEFDTYNTLQIKVVLLAGTNTIVPKVEQIQAIGVSA